MFKLDNQLLVDLGLGSLPADEKNRMLAHIYETLEMRVGMKLAEQMTDAQLDEFEGFIDRNDEAGALKWLETNFPNYKQVVADELEKLKAEIKTSAPQILAASQQAMMAAQQAAGGTPPMPSAQAQAFPQQSPPMMGQSYDQQASQQPPQSFGPQPQQPTDQQQQPPFNPTA
jgi:hypothetical protein